MAFPIVCEWRAWEQYLVRELLPEIEPVSVDEDATADALVERVLRTRRDQDTVLLHFDTSHPGRVPRARSEFIARLRAEGLRVWNGAVEDITKRSVQRHNARCGLPTTAASREGAPDERVIVKSNLNAYGIPESLLPGASRTPITGREYPVMERAAVPDAWWHDERLFVERFIENAEGRFFRFYVAGETCVLSSGTSSAVVRRIHQDAPHVNFLLRLSLVDGPELAAHMEPYEVKAFAAAVAFTRSFGLDYGSLDLVMDGAGVVYVIDANATPWSGQGTADAQLVAHLRRGLTLPAAATAAAAC